MQGLLYLRPRYNRITMFGIDHLKDFLEVLSFIATIIGGVAILFAVRDYSVSRKQLHLSVLQSCINRYRDHFSTLGPDSSCQQVIDYLDLINEELFYFEHKYLPLPVAHEWLDGMIEFLPLFDSKGQILNAHHCLPVIVQEGLMEQYRFRRIKRIFTLTIQFEENKIYGSSTAHIDQQERNRVIRHMLYNIRVNWSN